MNIYTQAKILNHLGLFNLVRDIVYHKKYLTPPYLNFYAQFINKNDLCFDVGANIGQWADIYLKLGAKVVAIEPQLTCVQYLKRKYLANPNVTIIDKALDQQKGEKVIYLSELNGLSTMSETWIQNNDKSGRYSKSFWDKKTSVKTTTLDELIAEYGKPVFCKIDVEGYESQVIQGLHHPIPYICLETTPESLEEIKVCIHHIASLGETEFNFSPGSRYLTFNHWQKATDMITFLTQLSPIMLYGDLYARTRQ